MVHPGPQFSVSDVYDGIVAGLKANGVQVAEVNLHERLNFYSAAHINRDGEWIPAFGSEAAVRMAAKGLEVACYEFWPDVVVVVSGFFIPPEVWGVLARRPHHVVYWCTESPYEDDRQSRPAQYADTVILNDPTNLDTYRAMINERTFYLPHSYDPARHFVGPGDPDLLCDFSFVGTGFPSRIDLLERVDWSGLTVHIGGNWQFLEDDSPLRPFLLDAPDRCIDNSDTAVLYRSSRCSANLYRKEHSDEAHADGWAMGPREVELAACGTFFLREPRPEGDELFPMLPTFAGADDFSDKLRWWLAHPAEREDAAHAAHVAIADRTFENTTAELLRLVDAAPAKIAV